MPILKICEVCQDEFKVRPSFSSQKTCSNKCKGISKQGELNQAWKDNLVRNEGLHSWVKRHLTKSDNCQLCGNPNKRLDLANKTGIYDRNFENWFYLCIKCHRNYDKPWLKRKDKYFKKGHEKTKEHLEKLSKSLQGRAVWNKGTKGLVKPNKGSFGYGR